MNFKIETDSRATFVRQEKKSNYYDYILIKRIFVVYLSTAVPHSSASFI